MSKHSSGAITFSPDKRGTGENSAQIEVGAWGTRVVGNARIPAWGGDAKDWAIYHLIEALAAESERADALAAHVGRLNVALAKCKSPQASPDDIEAVLGTLLGWLESSPGASLAQRDARVAAEAVERWRQDRKDLIRELTAMQNMTHGLARSGGCSPDYPNGAKAVIERVTGGTAPDFTDKRADEIAAGGGKTPRP